MTTVPSGRDRREVDPAYHWPSYEPARKRGPLMTYQDHWWAVDENDNVFFFTGKSHPAAAQHEPPDCGAPPCASGWRAPCWCRGRGEVRHQRLRLTLDSGAAGGRRPE